MPPDIKDRVLLLAKLGSSATVRTGRFMLKTCDSGLESEYTATCPKSSTQIEFCEWRYYRQ